MHCVRRITSADHRLDAYDLSDNITLLDPALDVLKIGFAMRSLTNPALASTNTGSSAPL